MQPFISNASGMIRMASVFEERWLGVIKLPGRLNRDETLRLYNSPGQRSSDLSSAGRVRCITFQVQGRTLDCIGCMEPALHSTMHRHVFSRALRFF